MNKIYYKIKKIFNNFFYNIKSNPLDKLANIYPINRKSYMTKPSIPENEFYYSPEWYEDGNGKKIMLRFYEESDLSLRKRIMNKIKENNNE